MGRTGQILDGQRLGQARIAADLKQGELADRVGIHRVTLTKIENGAPCSLELLERLAAELDVKREWLLGEPEAVDEFELARERMASAMAKIADGFEDFTSAVEALERRAREAAYDSGGIEVET